MENQDKVIKVETIDRPMTIHLKDGSKVEVQGKVINTHYESGRKDAKVIVPKM